MKHESVHDKLKNVDPNLAQTIAKRREYLRIQGEGAACRRRYLTQYIKFMSFFLGIAERDGNPNPKFRGEIVLENGVTHPELGSGRIVASFTGILGPDGRVLYDRKNPQPIKTMVRSIDSQGNEKPVLDESLAVAQVGVPGNEAVLRTYPDAFIMCEQDKWTGKMLAKTQAQLDGYLPKIDETLTWLIHSAANYDLNPDIAGVATAYMTRLHPIGQSVTIK